MSWIWRRGCQDYFLNYRETTSNDFVLRKGGDDIELLDTDISDWSITFIDTGLDTAIRERLRRGYVHISARTISSSLTMGTS